VSAVSAGSSIYDIPHFATLTYLQAQSSGMVDSMSFLLLPTSTNVGPVPVILASVQLTVARVMGKPSRTLPILHPRLGRRDQIR
jgi:hypothetical protein